MKYSLLDMQDFVEIVEGMPQQEREHLISKRFGSVFCGDDEIAAQLDLYTDADLRHYVLELAEELGLTFHDVNDTIHHLATGIDGGLYNGGITMFFDAELRKHLAQL